MTRLDVTPAGTALVTGVSRRAGIGYAVARRLLDRGDRVVVHSWSPHDAGQPWGADDVDAVVAALGSPPHLPADLGDPDAPAALVAAARAAAGPLTTLVVNHARSALGRLEEVTADELDRSFAVNARAAVLLTRAFAAQYEPAAGPGSVVLFTSGQHRGPMPGEIPYALSKGAVQQVTATLADAVAGRGITVNCVNPGPTDTGWAGPAVDEQVAAAMARGRWNTPEEAAAVVAWLTGPDARSVTGATIDAEGGFRR
ncbi:SDR family oxidoreductase [Geodermatophilus nigrescens]|uniref:SDR family oxidoreductase n=1 Tax=Geodermatophilus nigrescens TaxID=1070870 RepID=UPI0009F9C9DA|nr:SDR family oxidoreductase [Geodermatophilus nigrescens]